MKEMDCVEVTVEKEEYARCEITIDFREKARYNGHIYQKGGKNMLHFAEYDSPVGKLLLRSNGSALTGLWIGRELPQKAQEDAVVRKAVLWLDSYFRGEASPEPVNSDTLNALFVIDTVRKQNGIVFA